MENNAFETFIQQCGSVKQAAKALGLNASTFVLCDKGVLR